MKRYPAVTTLTRVILLIFCCIYSITDTAWAQNLENLDEAEPLKISGSINATGVGYTAHGIDQRRDPFNWFLNGNVNFNIYGWDIPFSFSYSNQDKTFQQPFNQYGVAPQYKWIKAYLGYHNLTYSSYTLAGHVFLGGAIELTPGKFNISAMYGRLNRAVEEDSINNVIPFFKRMGFALKAGYGNQQNGLDIILFHAKDDMESLPVIPEKSGILPMENLVLSLVGRKKLTNRISVQGELASSAITRDLRASDSDVSGHKIFLITKGLYQPRTSSEYYDAMKGSVQYAGNRYVLQVNYERVDPGYQTLGAYFFNNDLENITVSGALKLLADRLDLSVNAGTQRNNLDDTEVSAIRRTIASVQANFVPDQHWTVGGSYSNFTTYTNVRPRFDPFFQNELDTLNFYQINRNATASIGYTTGNKDIRHGVFFNGSFQSAGEEADRDSIPSTESRFYSGNVAYRYTHVPGSWSLSAALTSNLSEIDTFKTVTIGPNIIYTKNLFGKKLRTSCSAGYNQVVSDGELTGRVLTFRASGNMTVQKKHSFSLNLLTLRKFAVVETQNSFTEFTATVNYGYTF